MLYFRWRNFIFMFQEFSNFLVEGILLLKFGLLGHFSQLTFVELRVVVSFLALHTYEWVQEVFVSNCIRPVVHFADCHCAREFFSYDGITLLYYNKFLFQQNLA